MESSDAAPIFGALGQESRLEVLRLLISCGPERLAGAGDFRPPRDTRLDDFLSSRRARTGRADPGDAAGPPDHLCVAGRRAARAARLSDRGLLRRSAGAVRRPGRAAAALPEEERADDASLQCAVSLHPQFGALDHGRSDPRTASPASASAPIRRARTRPTAPMPEVLEKLRAVGHDVSGLHCKSWDLFTRPRRAAAGFRDRALRHARPADLPRFRRQGGHGVLVDAGPGQVHRRGRRARRRC